METEQLLAIYRRLTAMGLEAGLHDDSIGNAIKRLKLHRRKRIGIWVRIILAFTGLCFMATAIVYLSLTKGFWHFTPLAAVLFLVVSTYTLYISFSNELFYNFNRGFRGYRDDLAGLKCNPRTLDEHLRRGRALLSWDGPSAAAGVY